ncbi:MAG TPA: DUF1634 domain-containing protein [Vicinamibacterales bacterium]
MSVTNLSRLERIIGYVLRVGVATSTISLALGLLLSLTGAAASTLFLHIGIIALLVTPVARVCVSIAEYVTDRDWTFALLTLIVLAELAGGLIAALYGRKA